MRKDFRPRAVKFPSTPVVMLVLALCSACSTLRNVDVHGLSVAALGHDERIELEYESRGCFCHDRRSIVIHGGPMPTAEVLSAKGDFEHSYFGSGGGVLELSPEVVADLDRMMQRYRQLPAWRGRCTTRIDIDIRWVTAVRVAKESYVDDTCSDTTAPLREILRRVSGERQDFCGWNSQRDATDGRNQPARR